MLPFYPASCASRLNFALKCLDKCILPRRCSGLMGLEGNCRRGVLTNRLGVEVTGPGRIVIMGWGKFEL